MNIIVALLLFSLIVVIHEFGHFLAARLCGVKVLEFAVGMGPRLLSLKGKETVYALNLLPLGGYCRMLGEDGLTEEAGEGTLSGPVSSEPEEEGRSFSDKSVLQRFLIVFAGPLFNFLLAFLLALVIVFYCGVDPAKVSGVAEGYPAEEAGIQAGDQITALDGQKIVFFRELTTWFDLHGGDPVEVSLYRESTGERITTRILPKYNEERGSYMLGIYSQGARERAESPAELCFYAFHEVRFTVTATFDGLRMMILGRLSADNLTGPVGIVETIGETVEETKQYGLFTVFLNLVNLGLLLSANLGVMNLLPLPALDGGRLVFCVLEAVTRRRLNPEIEGYIHFAGFVLLMGFMVFVMMHDLGRIFG